MTSKYKLIIPIVFGTILFCQNSFAISNQQADENNKLKNFSKKAYEYFNDQLNFTTNVGGLKKAIDSKILDIKIIDVRAEKDFNISRIPGSINIPFNKFKSFEGDEIDFAGLTKEGYNYVICYEEYCNLSQKACKKFSSLGFKVKEVKGGFQGWKDHKYPLDNNKL